LRNVDLILNLFKEGEKQSQKTPMLLKGSFYETDFNDLAAGAYKFTVSVQGSKLKSYGGFHVQDFDIEKQFQNPNIAALEKLTTQNGGKLVFSNEVSDFVKELVADEKYKPIIKYSKEQKSLIHWRWLLGILLTLFTLEWFLRKFNGLI